MCFLVLLVIVKNTFLLCSAFDVKGNLMLVGVINAYDKHLFHLYHFGC
jgi:hypothetical protein